MCIDQSAGATSGVPLFLRTSESASTEGQSWIDLRSLAADTDLNFARNMDEGSFAYSSCESEPMCSISDAAAVSPTRAPILGATKRYEIPSKKADKRFPVLVRIIRKATSAASV